MEQDCRQVVAAGIHTPQHVVQSQSEPGDGYVVSEVGGREHPTKILPAESTVMRIHQKVGDVIPVEEVAPKGGKKRKDCEGGHEHSRPQGCACTVYLLGGLHHV